MKKTHTFTEYNDNKRIGIGGEGGASKRDTHSQQPSNPKTPSTCSKTRLESRGFGILAWFSFHRAYSQQFG